MIGVRPDMAEGAGHADTIRPDQILRIVVARVGVVANRVPSSRRRGIEIGIRKQPEADHPGGITVGGAHRKSVLATGADADARIFAFVLERVRRTVAAPRVEPEAEALRIRAGRFVEAGLIDKSEIVPAIVAAELQSRIGGEGLQQVERAERIAGHVVPEAIVAGGPDQPGVPAPDLGGRQRQPAIHAAEVVLIGDRQRRRAAAADTRLIGDAPGPGEADASSDQQSEPERDAPRQPRTWCRMPHRHLPRCFLIVMPAG